MNISASLLLSVTVTACDATFKPHGTERKLFYRATEEYPEIIDDMQPYDIDRPDS